MDWGEGRVCKTWLFQKRLCWTGLELWYYDDHQCLDCILVWEVVGLIIVVR